MVEVSDSYRKLADADARNIEVKIVIDETTFSADNIISLKIYRSIGSGGFAIGNATSDFCQFTLTSATRGIKSNAQVIPYVRFLNSGGGGEWLQLGVFWVTTASAGRTQLEVIAYDKMYTLDKQCTYLGTASGSVQALSFPCSMQQLLRYTCDIKGLECDFRCEDFTVETRPMIESSPTGENKYYTHRQMLGFIAGAHGANACFDSTGKLVFRQIAAADKETEDDRYIEALDCIDQNISSDEPFTILGIRLNVDDNTIFISDSDEGYDEDMEGIIEHDNPLGSIAVAEYIWKRLGNFSYYSCDFTRRGRGWIETGDLLNINDNILEWVENEKGEESESDEGGEDTEDGEGGEMRISSKTVNILAQSIELELSAHTGFIEHITSKAESAAESSNRISSGGGSSHDGCVGEFTNDAKNSERFNDYKNNTAEGNFSHTAGNNNKNSGYATSICGGNGNTITNGNMCVIAGGQGNGIDAPSGRPLASVISGGQGNKITGSHNGILGGISNMVNGTGYSAIAGGQSNKIGDDTLATSSTYNFIGAGQGNKIEGNRNAILSGQNNSISRRGGSSDVSDCVINSGIDNSIIGMCQSAIITGLSNKIRAGSGQFWNFIATGEHNTIDCSGNCNFIGAGFMVTMSGYGNFFGSSTSPTTIAGNNNTVFGSYNEVNHSNTFVSGRNLKTDGDEQVLLGYSNQSTDGKGTFVIAAGRNLLMLDRLGNLYLTGSLYTNQSGYGGGSNGASAISTYTGHSDNSSDKGYTGNVEVAAGKTLVFENGLLKSVIEEE